MPPSEHAHTPVLKKMWPGCVAPMNTYCSDLPPRQCLLLGVQEADSPSYSTSDLPPLWSTGHTLPTKRPVNDWEPVGYQGPAVVSPGVSRCIGADQWADWDSLRALSLWGFPSLTLSPLCQLHRQQPTSQSERRLSCPFPARSSLYFSLQTPPWYLLPPVPSVTQFYLELLASTVFFTTSTFSTIFHLFTKP